MFSHKLSDACASGQQHHHQGMRQPMLLFTETCSKTRWLALMAPPASPSPSIRHPHSNETIAWQSRDGLGMFQKMWWTAWRVKSWDRWCEPWRWDVEVWVRLLSVPRRPRQQIVAAAQHVTPERHWSATSLHDYSVLLQCNVITAYRSILTSLQYIFLAMLRHYVIFLAL